MEYILTEELLEAYRIYLYREEKSPATIEKYLADLRKLKSFSGDEAITKELMIRYKEHLRESGYKTASINSYLVAVNGFFRYMGWPELAVRTLRVQREVFVPEERELTRQEFTRLVHTAERCGRSRTAMILQTICATGMRVGELQFVTVEALRRGRLTIYNKGKERTILFPRALQDKLKNYIRKTGILSGMIFCTKDARPLNRSYIWREMKKLCEKAHVAPGKVFPHNLRALFARTHYGLFKDIAKLADILGHSSIETTRIYIKSSGAEHVRQLNRMQMLEGL